MVIGVDFGLSVTDAVAIEDGKLIANIAMSRPGPASVDVLQRALEALATRAAVVGSATASVGVTGGRSRELPVDHAGLELHKVAEPEAVGRGALALAGIDTALVVSCGTGTAMVMADATTARFDHVTGTPVGGGTLQAFGKLLLAGRSASEVAALAATGDASKVDTTLADVLGGSLGDLPPTATAASLGRLGAGEGPLEAPPAAADLAAGLCTMIAQTIALIAVNVATGNGSPSVICVGRVARYPVIAAMIEAVFAVYRYPQPPLFPAGADHATALGAALAAANLSERRRRQPAAGGDPASS